MGSSDFDAAVDSYRQALGAFFRGDPGPVADHFSRRDHVTPANPLGLPRAWPGRGGAGHRRGLGQLRGRFGPVRGTGQVQHRRPGLRRLPRTSQRAARGRRRDGPVVTAGDDGLQARGRYLEGRPPPRRPDHVGAADRNGARRLHASSPDRCGAETEPDGVTWPAVPCPCAPVRLCYNALVVVGANLQRLVVFDNARSPYRRSSPRRLQ